MSAQARAMANPTVPQESIYAFLDHMSTLLAAVTHIWTVQGSMDQTKMDTFIAFIKDTSPVSKSPPIYAHNPFQIEKNSIIDYVSSVGIRRCSYTTAALSHTKFDHTTFNVLEITTSLTKRSSKSGWGYGTGSITEIKVGTKTYYLFQE